MPENSRVDNPMDAFSKILQTYTKKKNAENEFKKEMLLERHKRKDQMMDYMAKKRFAGEQTRSLETFKSTLPARPKAQTTRPSRWEIEKEARTRIGQMTKNDWQFGEKLRKDPTLYDRMMSNLVKKMSARYGYAPEEPIETPQEKPMGQAETSKEYEIGAIYEGEDGRRAKYVGGEQQWEIQ